MSTAATDGVKVPFVDDHESYRLRWSEPRIAVRGYRYLGRTLRGVWTRVEHYATRQLSGMSTRTVYAFLLIKVAWFLFVLTAFWIVSTMPISKIGLSAVESRTGVRLSDMDSRTWVAAYVLENVMWIACILWIVYQHRKFSTKTSILPFYHQPLHVKRAPDNLHSAK